MASAVSTETGKKEDWRGQREAHCVVAPGVRARRESFGILFYHSRNAKLTFVKSGNLLDLVCTSDGMLVLGARTRQEEDQERIERFITSLLKKGLILEKSIC